MPNLPDLTGILESRIRANNGEIEGLRRFSRDLPDGRAHIIEGLIRRICAENHAYRIVASECHLTLAPDCYLTKQPD